MTRSRALLQLAGAIQALVALTVVWMALGASNVYPLDIPVGRIVRWVALAQLAALALLYAFAADVRAARRFWPAIPAALLLAVALASTAWSPDPRLTFGRALTFAALFVAGVGVATLASRPRGGEIVVLAIVAGAAAVALGSLVELAVEPDDAIVPATRGQGARYQGLGQNPNTLALLFAVVLPLSTWLALKARGGGWRVAAAALALVLYGSIVASGSRGAIVAAVVGAALTALAVFPRRRLLVGGAAAAAVAIGLAATQLPPRADRDPVLNPEFGSLSPVPVSPRDVSARLPLENEVGLPPPGTPTGSRTLLSPGGRTAAWRGALEQYAERPVAGYGFGTEERVFVDRYNLFLSDRIENSYLAALLQLGPVGLALLVLALAAPLGRWVRSPRSARAGPGAACAGAVAAGALVAFTQSFAFAVGSPPTVPLWLCLFVLAAPLQEADEGDRDEREEQSA